MEGKMDDQMFPPLPEPIIISDEPAADVSAYSSDRGYYFLPNGCYSAKWGLASPASYDYNGIVRIERHRHGVTASGDFYYDPKSSLDPNPKSGIPIFLRTRYRFYLRITSVLEYATTAKTFILRFERYWYNHSRRSWTDNGEYYALMTFRTAPSNYPSGAVYLSGLIKNSRGHIVGYLTMGRVSNFLRKAVIEVDRVRVSEYPADNGVGLDWKDVYRAVDWDLIAYQSHSNIRERSGSSWSLAELHAQMLDSRYTANLDREWRYHLLCVRHLDYTSRGVMYDGGGTDSNKLPREGAAISSHWVFPSGEKKWGDVKGQRFGASSGPYFRTAVHEIGHAMGLRHNIRDNGFMNTTPEIAASSGVFPNNIQWSFNDLDERLLRHLPDPWIRPGMLPYRSVGPFSPLSPVDRLDFSESVSVEVKPLLSTVPIGAPVRVKVTLRNITDRPLEVPPSLSLMSGYVSGSVIGSGGFSKAFKSIIHPVDENDVQMLEPNADISHDLTLLRGPDGALFAAPGLHQVNVEVAWDRDDAPVFVRGFATVMVQPAVTDNHAEAARKTLSSPDLLLTLALGGDHLKEGVEALEAALADDVLAPHYAVIQAKRLARSFRTRDANPSAALKMLKNNPVMSVSEANRIAALTEGASNTPNSMMNGIEKSALVDNSAEQMMSKLKL